MIDVLYWISLRVTFGLSMDVVWQHMTVELLEFSCDNPGRVNIFFSLLERLMLAGDIKLACDGVF
jgi:hypothetical protein